MAQQLPRRRPTPVSQYNRRTSPQDGRYPHIGRFRWDDIVDRLARSLDDPPERAPDVVVSEDLQHPVVDVLLYGPSAFRRGELQGLVHVQTCRLALVRQLRRGLAVGVLLGLRGPLLHEELDDAGIPVSDGRHQRRVVLDRCGARFVKGLRVLLQEKLDHPRPLFGDRRARSQVHRDETISGLLVRVGVVVQQELDGGGISRPYSSS